MPAGYSSAIQDFQQVCGLSGQVSSFRTLATLIARKLKMQKQRLQHLTEVFETAGSASEMLSLIPDLVQSLADQLDYSTAISYIDTELESLMGATKDECGILR